MKRFLALLLTLLGLAIHGNIALGQLSQLQRAELQSTNLLGPWNPGFESGKQSWTNTGATFAITTATVLDGTTSASWTPTASGQTLDSKAVTVPAGLLGGQCQAQLLYKGGDANTTFEVYDVTAAGIVGAASVVLTAATTPSTLVIPFNCPSSADSIKLRLTSTAAGAIVYLDKAFLGLAAQNGVTSISPVVFSQAKTLVGSVGTAGQIAAGHILTQTEWPFTIAGKLAYYNFSTSTIVDNSSALSCSSGTAACTLTASGTPTIGSSNIFGTANSALTLNGTSQYLTSTDAFFNPGNVNFAFGGWFNSTNWASGSTQILFGNQTTGNSGFFVQNLSNQITFVGSTSTTTSVQAVVTTSFAANSWHHFALVYSPTTGFRGFIDGKNVAQIIGTQYTLGTSAFRIGALNSTPGAFFSGSVEDFFAINGYAATDDDIRRIYATSWSHNKNLAVANQWLTGNWYRADSNVANQLTSAWVVNKGLNTLYTDFSDIASTAYVDFSMSNTATTANNIPISSYDSGWLSTTPATTIAHGLSAPPSNLVIQYESNTPSAGNYQNLDAGDYCSFDSTNLYCDWTSLTVSSSNQVRILAWQAGASTAVTAAGAANSGIVNTSAQTFAGAKTFSTPIAGSSLATATTTTQGAVTLKAPTQQIFTSGSGTYITPSGAIWLRVRMVGGGGGGSGGAGTGGTPTAGSNGTASTFGSSFLTAGPGGGALTNASGGGGGSTPTIGSGATGIVVTGTVGAGAVYYASGAGGNSVFGGGGSAVPSGGNVSPNGVTANANSGSGGSGGANNVINTTSFVGEGGGSGGFIDAIIAAPLASYAYTVGAGGAGGSGGTGGGAGGSGAAGIIAVEEHYY